MISHTQNGDTTVVFDGCAGWVAAANNPCVCFPMMPSKLDGGKLDAILSFPNGIKQALSNWKVGFAVTSIDDKDVNIVQGTGVGNTRFKLYFETKTDLLSLGKCSYADTPVGMVPTQVDYKDYREVTGVKTPYKFEITWTQRAVNDLQLNEVQPNAAGHRFGEV